MGIGQKSSDDEVSEFVIPSRTEVIFEIKSLNDCLLGRECLYSIHETVIISITVPIVKESLTAMEVTLFGPMFHKD